MKKQDLIIMHGFRGAPDGVKKLASYFPDNMYNVYTPAVPPVNGNPLEKYDADHYAKFLADFIDSHKLKKPIVVGHSMGSIVAAATAEKYPDKINDKLVLMSPISSKPAKFFAMLTPLSVILPNRIISHITTRYLFIPHDKKLYKEAVRLTYLCGSKYPSKKEIFKSAIFSANTAISDFHFSKQTFFISGETDRLVPRKKTISLAKLIGAKTDYIPNTGHLINYEAPETTAKKIRAFLEN